MKKRIIAVEDEPEFASLLKRVMPEYEVELETDGGTALRDALKSPPDLFLLDIRLSGASGKELAFSIDRNDRLRGTPIIFLSALVHPAAAVPVEDDGEPVSICGHPAFGKPFDLAKLKRCVEDLVSEHRRPGSRRLRPGVLVGE